MTVRAFQGIKPSFGKDAYIDPMALVLGDVQMGMTAQSGPAQ